MWFDHRTRYELENIIFRGEEHSRFIIPGSLSFVFLLLHFSVFPLVIYVLFLALSAILYINKDEDNFLEGFIFTYIPSPNLTLHTFLFFYISCVNMYSVSVRPVVDRSFACMFETLARHHEDVMSRNYQHRDTFPFDWFQAASCKHECDMQGFAFIP